LDRHTDPVTVTDPTDHRTYASATISVGNNADNVHTTGLTYDGGNVKKLTKDTAFGRPRTSVAATAVTEPVSTYIFLNSHKICWLQKILYVVHLLRRM